MSKVLIALMFLARSALADGVPLPAVQAGEYSDAINKALKAAAIQSGVQQDLDIVAGVASREATIQGNKAITAVTPFQPKTVYMVLGTGYALGVKREFKKSFKNPLFPNVTNTLRYTGKGDKTTELTWGVSF